MMGQPPTPRWPHCDEASRDAGHGSVPHRIEEADVADADAVAAMIDRVIAAWGRLDVLVNNAGIQSETPGDRFDDDALERILSVNLLGAARCARAAIRHFLSRPGGGVIINTSSVHEIVPKPGFLAYSIAKGGLGNLTRTLALEFAAHGIRVNAVGPGATITDLNRAWTEDRGEACGGGKSHSDGPRRDARGDRAGLCVSGVG